MLGRTKRAVWGFVVAALTLSSAALAVTQPSTGGVTIPVVDATKTVCADKNVQVCLDLAEGAAGKINADTDALVVPETFQPTCQLTFTPIVKGGSIYDVFGWYNVKKDPTDPTKFLKPTQAELYGMFVAHDFQTPAQLAGQSVVLDLGVEAAAGRYTGGEIGFFFGVDQRRAVDRPDDARRDWHDSLSVSYPARAQRRQRGRHHVLQRADLGERRQENTFYFGWEDLPTNQAPITTSTTFVLCVRRAMRRRRATLRHRHDGRVRGRRLAVQKA